MVYLVVMAMPATSISGPALIMIAPCRFLASMRPMACSPACVTSDWRILTSPAVRCVQTVEPLSQRRAVPIELVDALRVDAPVGTLLELVTDPGLEMAVLCGHGEQIGGLVRQLADSGLMVDAPLRCSISPV